MVEMDSFTLVRHIRALAEHAYVPIIMLSSRGLSSDNDLAADAGCDVFMVKPVRFLQLRKELFRLLSKKVEAPRAREIITSEIRPIVPHGHPKPRLLLAEDNPINQKVALRILERMGCKANAVGNGREAIVALADIPYDIVLMDIQMPEMDGYEATRLIRESESRTGRHIPIIAMTAHATKEDRDRCLTVGMDDYLAKPIQVGLLAKMLQRYVTGIKSPDSATDSPSSSQSPTSAHTNETIFNRDLLLNNLEGDLDAFHSILDLFQSDTIRGLGRVRHALGARDFKALRESAHSIKGASGNVGAETICLLASALERAARMEDFDLCQNQFADLQTAFKEFTREVLLLRDGNSAQM